MGWVLNRMYGNGESTKNRRTQVRLEIWPLNTSACVIIIIIIIMIIIIITIIIIIISAKEVMCLPLFVCWLVCLLPGLLKRFRINCREIPGNVRPWNKKRRLDFKGHLCVCVCARALERHINCRYLDDYILV